MATDKKRTPPAEWILRRIAAAPPEKRSRWAAVSIVMGKTAGCAAARLLQGRRFLAAEAPRLPLAECSCSDSCSCVYKKYPDRRAGPRREQEESGLRRHVEAGRERRVRRGRRESD